MLLDAHIRQKLGGSLSSGDAQQFAFLLFLTLVCIPPELRSHKWDRDLITSEFSDLVRAGIIVDSSEAMREPQFWDELITSGLRQRIELDLKLVERLFQQAR